MPVDLAAEWFDYDGITPAILVAVTQLIEHSARQFDRDTGMKLLLQIVATFALINWPMMFMMSPMGIGGPGASNRLGNVLGIILMLAFPLPIGLLFHHLDWGLLWMEPKTLLVVTSLAASAGGVFYSFLLFNILRGVSNEGYTIKPKAVYHGGWKIKNSDSSTFEIMSGDRFEFYARDKNHVYRAGKALPGADPATFRFLGSDSPYAKDRSNVYCSDRLVAGADAATFEPLLLDGEETTYWRDKDHVYVNGKPMALADPATFEPLTKRHSKHSFARDKNHVYEYDRIINGADAVSFVLLNEQIAKDKHRVYRASEAILPTANVAEFRLIGDGTFAADDQRVYFLGSAVAIVLDEANPASFAILDRWYAKGSSAVYFYAGREVSRVIDADPETFVVLDSNFDDPSDAKDCRRDYKRGVAVVPQQENDESQAALPG